MEWNAPRRPRSARPDSTVGCCDSREHSLLPARIQAGYLPFEGKAPVGGSALRRTAVSHDGRCGESLLEEQLLTDRCLMGIRSYCVPLRVDLAL